MIPLNHVPLLFLGTVLTLGGALPFARACAAIQDFGLPARVADSAPAQAIMRV